MKKEFVARMVWTNGRPAEVKFTAEALVDAIVETKRRLVILAATGTFPPDAVKIARIVPGGRRYLMVLDGPWIEELFEDIQKEKAELAKVTAVNK